MGFKRKLLVLALVVCGTYGQGDIWDSGETPTVYTTTTLAPTITGSRSTSVCTVGGQPGDCVESRAYCRTPNTGIEVVSWRSADICGSGVCCVLADVVPTTSAPTIATPPPPGPTTVTPSPPGINTQRPNPTLLGCGLRDENSNFFRAGTSVVQAKFGEFPWTIAIFRVKNGKEIYWCVGSLIHPRIVLTVANRFDRKGQFRVRAGDWNLPNELEMLQRQDREVESVVIHEFYSSGFAHNDVGLLFLDRDIIPDKHINYACLPNANVATQTSVTCYMSGWGRVTKNGPLQDTQKMVELPVVDRNICLTKLREGLHNDKYQLHSSMMCAGGNGQDGCKGDGGAPLVCPYPGQDERFYQAGIVSWGVDCQVLPGVYSDVAVHREWIDQRVKEKGYTTNYYTP